MGCVDASSNSPMGKNPVLMICIAVFLSLVVQLQGRAEVTIESVHPAFKPIQIKLIGTNAFIWNFRATNPSIRYTIWGSKCLLDVYGTGTVVMVEYQLGPRPPGWKSLWLEDDNGNVYRLCGNFDPHDWFRNPTNKTYHTGWVIPATNQYLNFKLLGITSGGTSQFGTLKLKKPLG